MYFIQFLVVFILLMMMMFTDQQEETVDELACYTWPDVQKWKVNIKEDQVKGHSQTALYYIWMNLAVFFVCY